MGFPRNPGIFPSHGIFFPSHGILSQRKIWGDRHFYVGWEIQQKPPLPSKPAGHSVAFSSRHRKLPSMLRQVLPVAQETVSSHSLISLHIPSTNSNPGLQSNPVPDQTPFHRFDKMNIFRLSLYINIHLYVQRLSNLLVDFFSAITSKFQYFVSIIRNRRLN